MVLVMSRIIQLLFERINLNNSDLSFQTESNPPVSLTEIQEAEGKLGCKLPNLLRNIYLEVGNGGFGQQFRLLPLANLFTVHARKNRRYLEAIGDDPVGLTYLVICDWGCSVYSCIDCSNPLYPVLRYDAVGGFFIPEKPSFEAWVSAWVNGENLWNAIMEKEIYDTFVNITTATQNLNAPLLLVLSEWIDELLVEKK